MDWSFSDGLATTVPAALSLATMGCGITHFDIGGYTTIDQEGSVPAVSVKVNMVRDEELFFRGAEMAVFTPIMRTHEGMIGSIVFVLKDVYLRHYSEMSNEYVLNL